MSKIDEVLERITGLLSDMNAQQKESDRMTEFPLDTIVSKRSNDANIREFQRRCDDLLIVSKILNKHPRELKLYKELFEPISEIRKALDMSAISEWMPTGFSAELFAAVELELKVAALHTRVKMPTNPYKIPISSGKVMAKIKSEATAPAESSFITPASVTLDAVPLVTYVSTSYEADEESIIPLLPLIRQEIVKALARAQETATINGDTTGGLDEITDASDPRRAWNGYRKVVENTAKIDALGTFNVKVLRYARQLMGKWGVNPDDLAWVVSIAGYNMMMTLPEVITMDKYGERATILKGELARLDNIPIIVSEYVPDDLNTNGEKSGTGNTTVVILVNRNGFVYGDRREVLIETDRNIKAQTIDLVASQRVAFTRRVANGETVVAVIYNVPTSIS